MRSTTGLPGFGRSGGSVTGCVAASLHCRAPSKQRSAICSRWSSTCRWRGSRACAERLGTDVRHFPLSAYRDRSFYTMRTDALDRFGTRLERRFSRRGSHRHDGRAPVSTASRSRRMSRSGAPSVTGAPDGSVVADRVSMGEPVRCYVDETVTTQLVAMRRWFSYASSGEDFPCAPIAAARRPHD